jgi:DNA repair protein RecO (recombination protein O)
MPIERDEAIVLRLTEYSETSQIATLFGAAGGRLRLIAKGIRRGTAKRIATGLDLLELGDVQFLPARGESGLGTLTEWTQRDTFAGLRRELLRLYAALYAGELLATFTEDRDPHPALYHALRTLLYDLAGSAPAAPLVPRFQLALLTEIGYAPRLDQCVNCGRVPAPRTPVYFSATTGGLICRDCEMHLVEKRRIDSALLTGRPGSGDARAWFELLDYHAASLVGHSLRSAAPLAAELARPRR